MADPNTISIAYGALAGAASSALVAYLAKQIFEASIVKRITAAIQFDFDTKLEAYKDKLKSQSEIEIAKLKADLDVAVSERNFRFTHVFGKTAETIAETYKRLIVILDAAKRCTELRPISTDLLVYGTQYANELKEFAEFFKPNSIYLPPETADKVRVFSDTLRQSLLDYTNASIAAAIHDSDKVHDEKLYAAYVKATVEVPKLLESLGNDFQTLLGIPIGAKR